MSNNEIITILGKKRYVEKLVKYYSRYVSSSELYSRKDYLDDFSQDIYLQLYEMNNKFLQCLYNTNELEYYVRRIIKNNLFTTNSRFYSNYIKPIKNLNCYEDDQKC